MSGRLSVALCVGAALIAWSGQQAAAQVDVHAHAVARASCQSGKHSDAVVDAKVAQERSPDDLGPRMRLADALVDQGCYQEAVEILESAQETFPRNSELSGKLRDVRSLVTEQTYIEGLTQAAEGAKIARNQLRCTKLADVTACEDALHAKPDDPQLLLAKGDALMQANRPADAVSTYRHLSQLKPGDEAVKAKLANAESLQAKNQPPAPSQSAGTAEVVAANGPAGNAARKSAGSGTTTTGRTASSGATAGNAATRRQKAPAVAANREPAPLAPQPNGGQRLTATPTAAVAALAPAENKTYSNDATPGQTN